MDRFPLFFDLRDRSALLVGGGEIAAQKLRLVAQAGARVLIVARAVQPEIAQRIATGEVDWAARDFLAADLAGKVLAIAATGDLAEDETVARAARAASVPVNVVDRAHLSDFLIPAIVDRAPVTIAIGSNGASPILARELRAKIEALLPARLGQLARFAERFRQAVAATFADRALRARFWENFFAGPVAEAVLAGREREANEKMLALVNRREARPPARGQVAIVGAGPGDPDLLTFKAMRFLQQADLVVYDRLVGPEILNYARRDARRLYVGKARGAAAVTQDQINALLLAEAEAGHRVVRLKGGDPFIFGRGGEELAFLKSHGIAVEIVPGITAALGCAAAAGLPLTHRDHAQSLTFLTAESQAGAADHDWTSLARPGQTRVIYMGVGAAPRLQVRLLEAGLDPATPVAAIENGTRPDQRLFKGRIDGLADLIRLNQVAGPALIVIGETAGLAAIAETDARPADLSFSYMAPEALSA